MTDPAHRKSPDSPDPARPDIPDYTLLRPIGRGSYGDVWLARSVTGVFRVIKVVQRCRFEDDRPYLRELEGISRFQAAVSGRPRQLALLHVGRNDEAGYFYYVMEPADDAESGSAIDPDRYVPLTLREMLRRRGRLSAQECVEFTLELARGLAVLHGENLIHRDIKPSNVIFVQRTPKLADVGLVASADATLTGVGTLGYLPPEGPGSVAADIYSLGKVLYQIATGMDQSQYPRIPKELASHPDAPLLREINSIVLKACSPYPAQRHPSADILARDLELIQAGRSVAFYEDFRKRSRRILAVTATLALVAGLAAALFVWRAQILQRANEQTRRALYRSDLAVAQLEKASGDFSRARLALNRQYPRKGEEDLRGIEWYILAHSVRSQGIPLQRLEKSSSVTQITVDSTGRWVAGAFSDDRTALWDLRTGRIAKIINEARVIGGFLSNETIVVDAPSRLIRYESPTTGLISTWATGLRLRALLADGRIFGVTPEGDYVYRLLEKGSEAPNFELNLSKLYPGAKVSSLDISPDGKRFAIGFYIENGAIRNRRLLSIDTTTSKVIWEKIPQDSLGWLFASPNNTDFLVNIGWTTPAIEKFDSPEASIPLTGHSARINSAAYSTDGKFIATASADQTIRTWDGETGKLLSVNKCLDRPLSAVAWLPDGKFILAGDESGSIQAFPVSNEETADSLGGLFSDMHGDFTTSSDDETIAVTQAKNLISIVSSKSLKTLNTVSNLFQPICFASSNNELIAFASDWSIWRVILSTKEMTKIGNPIPADFSVVSWALANDETKMVVSSDNGRIALIDVKTARASYSEDPSQKPLWALAFSNDSTELWTASANGSIRRWHSDKALHLVETILEGVDEIQTIAVSPAKDILAVSFVNDASIGILDLHRKNWIARTALHKRYAQSLFFVNKGTRLISGGVDGRVIAWSMPEFQEITSFSLSERNESTGDEGIASLKLSPKGSMLVALTEDGRLQLWRSR